MPNSFDGHVNWQWNLNVWSKQDSPAAAVRHYLATRAENSGAAGGSGGADTAFAWLCYGQRHQPDVVALYWQRRAAAGDTRLYVDVLSAAGDREPDFDQAAVHLEWQTHSDPLSLVRAADRWSCGPEPDAVAAMFEAQVGQSHNGNAAQLYRACLRADPDRFFALVERLVSRLRAGGLRHPYLDGHEPSSTALRDEVPAPGGRS